MIFSPETGAQVLAMVLIVYLFIDGLTSLIIAIKLPPVGGGAWLMFSSIASLIIAVLMWRQWPASGDLAIGILIGVKLLLDGISLIGIGLFARKAID